MGEAKIRYDVLAGESEGFRTWTLSSDGELQATFAPEAGMLCCSLLHRGEELLHLGEGLAHYARTGATIGIPLLYPWANRLSTWRYSFAGHEVSLDRDSPLTDTDPNGLPIHGLLGGSPHWSVRHAGGDGDSAKLVAELDFGAHQDLLTAFPFPHVLRLEARLRESELALRTTVTAAGKLHVPVSFGYHPYFRLPGVPREQWEIELPVEERLVLNEWMIPTGRTETVRSEREPLGARSFDDGFARLLGKPFVASGGGRRIAVRFDENYPFAQVYTPPGADFICFEPMTAPTNALVSGAALPAVRPSESFSATFAVSVV
jgi:galactose mutarotase-like enzyme